MEQIYHAVGKISPRDGKYVHRSLCQGGSAGADDLLAGANHELIVVVPLSSSAPRSALRPEIDTEAGIDADSIAIPRAIRGVARRRLLRRLGVASAETLAEVEAALATVLDLEQPASGSGSLLAGS